MKKMTAQQLFDFLEQIIHDGHGNARVLFDTEARTFNYRMAQIGSAYLEEEPSTDGYFVNLGEKKGEKN